MENKQCINFARVPCLQFMYGVIPTQETFLLDPNMLISLEKLISVALEISFLLSSPYDLQFNRASTRARHALSQVEVSFLALGWDNRSGRRG
jgi:hypothetical protein